MQTALGTASSKSSPRVGPIMGINLDAWRQQWRLRVSGSHWGWWWREGLMRAEGRSIEITPRLMMHIDGIISGKMLKYRKVTRPGIEPRTFWTYTRCSNQLSYLALEFNQLILYLCNCQPKDTYSARHIQSHSLHARSTLWPWHDQISQSGNHVTDYIIQFQQKKASMCVISPGIIEMYLTSLI